MSDESPGSQSHDMDAFARMMLDLSNAMDRFTRAMEDFSDPQVFAEFLADDVEMVDWTHRGNVFRGKDEVFRHSFADIPAFSPDARFELTRAIRADDLLIVCGFFYGTFTSDLPSYKATNQPIRWEARDIY